MATLPLGVGAYLRRFGGEPEVKLVNRFAEQSPVNLKEKLALLARSGTNALGYFAGGNIRATFSKLGLFNGDLFVVSGENLYRCASDGTQTPIIGVIAGTGHPALAWMKGIGYEFAFIADGTLLQFYPGPASATGILTSTGAIAAQVINIGGTYYSWSATVNAGTPAGTSGAPWLALLGGTAAESLANMVKLLNFTGISGTDYSSALAGASTQVTAVSDVTTMTISSIVTDATGDTIATTIFSGSDLAWGDTTLQGGGVHALHGVAVPDGVGIRALASVAGFVLASVDASQKFFWINPGETTIDALNFAEKESAPDVILDMLTVGEQAFIYGAGETEVWYATGDLDAPFAPVQGRAYERGVIEGTAVVVQDAVILVGDDGVVYTLGMLYGGQPGGVNRVSNNGIEERIRTQLRREQGISP